MIGDIVVLVEDHTFINTPYKKGQKFKVIGDSGMRGLDIESLDTGEKIYETAFSSSKYQSLVEFRNNKINKIC